MKPILTLTILLHELYRQIVIASITGVTYMDNFNFEQRYRDVNECNPFHWHPLHLPPECVQMFENLIRSRLKPLTPYNIVKERTAPEPTLMYPNNYVYNPIYTDYQSAVEYLPVERKSPSQYEILYELLKRDVHDLPSVPFLAVSPYLGVIAMYKQPVSYKSVAMIKKLARAYNNSDLFSRIESGVNNNIAKHDNSKGEPHKDNTNLDVDANNVVKGNDVIALLKIKKNNQ